MVLSAIFSKDVHEVEAPLLHVVDADLNKVTLVNKAQHRCDLDFFRQAAHAPGFQNKPGLHLVIVHLVKREASANGCIVVLDARRPVQPQ